MKCPKCGSENTFIVLPKKVYGSCRDCNKMWNEQINYKQRLDKVLSKFEKDENGYSLSKKHIWIEYNWDDKKDNKFRLGLFYDIIISLETVELLLKDLEVQDE